MDLGRSVGGTHFLAIDADEVVVAGKVIVAVEAIVAGEVIVCR